MNFAKENQILKDGWRLINELRGAIAEEYYFSHNDFEKTLEIAKSLTGPDIANDTQVGDIAISCYESGTADNVWPGAGHIWTQGLDDLLAIKERDDDS